MMDGLDDHPDLLSEDQTKGRSETVDLNTDTSLLVDISDALSERDKVKFTVHTKTTLPEFRDSEFNVVRQHEEFKLEARVASDEDLKLSDLMRYYMRDSQAAKDLLLRRTRCLSNYENANKALEKARAKNKDVQQAETNQQRACERFEKISDTAKHELTDFRMRRVGAFRKHLVELAELELKHAKAQMQLLRTSIASLKEEQSD
ncbi:sorting nexin-6-like [Saccoglossus kowalevskii]|uniref:Sorting nexin-6-like n=1 Tax=Saccoglossus kowalevskii TaxID=10224 RepID=A0ABM0MKD8_SACKO|nr:PREDICTED: sorting nexin-6-like [Saccoglossus kowalevskii]